MPSALVTGAGRGIGEAIALRLVHSGWTVFAGVRDAASGERLAAQDSRIAPVLLDITDQAHVAALDDRLPDRLDALVNNAGMGVLGPVEVVSIPDLRRQFEVNVFAQVAVTQAVLPRIRAARGRIVFISSTGGRAPVLMEGAYCASKSALEALADVLRVELRPWHIDVSVVGPGRPTPVLGAGSSRCSPTWSGACRPPIASSTNDTPEAWSGSSARCSRAPFIRTSSPRWSSGR
ncbi:MAG: SDR family NAD(P)-dependent oxidoreductase [Dermatophilaceae bacterium]